MSQTHNHRFRWHPQVVAFALFAACGGGPPEIATDTTTSVIAAPDTTAALTLRDSAKATLATLVPEPSRAVFDSIVVIQPPHDGERLPAMAVCGRIAGLPGRTTPARFVYQSKWTVFVEETANQAAFGDLWARSCVVAGGVVVVRE